MTYDVSHNCIFLSVVFYLTWLRHFIINYLKNDNLVYHILFILM